VAKDDKTWGIISVESSPIFSRFNSKLISANGLPEISTTARDKAYGTPIIHLYSQFAKKKKKFKKTHLDEKGIIITSSNGA
jgi:hypothetical protein